MLIYVLIGLVICGLFACQIAEQKQAGNRGFWLGLFLGPAGVIAAGFMDGRSQCPHCGGRLNDTKEKQFDVCPNCRSDLAVDRRQATERATRPVTKQEPSGISSFSHLLHSD